MKKTIKNIGTFALFLAACIGMAYVLPVRMVLGLVIILQVFCLVQNAGTAKEKKDVEG